MTDDNQMDSLNHFVSVVYGNVRMGFRTDEHVSRCFVRPIPRPLLNVD